MVYLTFFLLIVLLLLICYMFVLLHRRRNYFAHRNIPSPPISSLILGHLSTLWSATSYSHQLYKWTEELKAPTYGLFEGTRPLYVSSDVHFLQEIFAKQFHKFNSRRTTFFARLAGIERAHLVIAEGAQWKRQRNVLNPTFSAVKMRPLVPIIDECVNVLIDQLAKIDEHSPINMCEIYKRFSMDVICRCAFGINDNDVQKDSDNIYLAKTTEMFSKDAELRPLAKVNRLVPELGEMCACLFHILRYFRLTLAPANLWLIENIGHLVHVRLQNNYDGIIKHRLDLMQLMIDAAGSDTPRLSRKELLSNVMAVLTAGHETTSFALGSCTYVLATYPDIQVKVYEEIREQLELAGPVVDYDLLVSKLTYMDIFIREVLRMYPVSIQTINRQCMEDADVCGYKITKGSRVQVDVISLHNNSDLWGPHTVNKFYPERHLTKRHPLAYMPFGAGPRVCIGARLALLEMKLCLTRLLYKYKIYPANGSCGGSLDTEEVILIEPKNVYIKLEKRCVSVEKTNQNN